MKKIFASTAIALAVFATAPAQAQDNLTGRVVVGVGAWIAAQGNQALVDLKKDVQDQIADHLRPLLPPMEKSKQAPASETAPKG